MEGRAKCSKVQRRKKVRVKFGRIARPAGAYLDTNSFVEFDDELRLGKVFQGQPEPMI